MRRISRRAFLKTASASAACAAVWSGARQLMANPLGLPIGLQLYSVRELLPKDYDGTLRQLGALGYREVEAAGFFGHTPGEVKQAMDHAGLNCVSAHYPLRDLLPKVNEVIQFGKDLGLRYIVCASPWLKDPSRVKDPGSRAARDAMTLEDWRWNAEQFNRIGELVNAAGIRFAYHNHTAEFSSENGVVFYDELLRTTDPTKVTMEIDCGWVVVGGKNPVQTPQTVTIRVPAGHGSSAYFLPFLGNEQKLEGVSTQGRVTFTLPPISKGAAFWLQSY